MLKNCVFKVSVDNRKWLKAAGIRAVKTVAQAAIAGIGTAAALGQVDWKYVLSASVMAGVISILTSIAGIPEVGDSEADNTAQEKVPKNGAFFGYIGC